MNVRGPLRSTPNEDLVCVWGGGGGEGDGGGAGGGRGGGGELKLDEPGKWKFLSSGVKIIIIHKFSIALFPAE